MADAGVIQISRPRLRSMLSQALSNVRSESWRVGLGYEGEKDTLVVGTLQDEMLFASAGANAKRARACLEVERRDIPT